MKLSEEEILEGCLKQKPAAQEALYKKYGARMMAVCMRYAHTTFEAEDIFQEGFVRIFKSIFNFSRTGSLEGWMKQIMVNTAINHYHINKKHYSNEEFDKHFDIQHHDADAISDISAEEITAMISQLADGYRIVFNLFVVEGYSHLEIADMLQISEGTSKSQLSKAKQLLRKMILNLKHPNYVTE